MTMTNMLPLLVLGSSLLVALIIFMVPEPRYKLRTTVNLLAAVIKLILVAGMAWGVLQGGFYETRFPVMPGLDFVLRADSLSVVFAGLSALLWLLTTCYAIGYLKGSANQRRFFGFFSFCVASTLGIALAGNLFTFLLFYEILTLSTYPLVVHRGTEAALRAGKQYLIYTLSGGAVMMLGVVWLQAGFGDLDFIRGGHREVLAGADTRVLVAIFMLLIGGLAVKAAIVPLHGWLPSAMVAPAPVSALLHAVAVVKAGVFGIVRVVYDLFGSDFAAELGLLLPLGILAAFTILYGSVRALYQVDLKRRLAFSTVSQVSYITLGVTLLGPLATVGAVVHLIHQGVMKITLFFCAGIYAETLGIHRIDELDGAGRRMPVTSVVFTVGALGMIGLPPLAGFISKWYLGLGALEAGMVWVIPVLVASTMLNAAYFLPIVHRLWFRPQRQGADWAAAVPGRPECHRAMLWPAIITGLFVVLLGLLASLPMSPLQWGLFMAEQEYGL
ncbi:MAG: monovalent cation/H+ antiporter subunit D family protein [Halomonadaceae bacterium]|nr:MAG: monovalent cation/H+ antiporter subunit D family protein [Halomonadaceae bacterium]